ncbi:hypothetical protein HDU86_007184 [Geranomyces michiganensis]|nr:hypothetical protein HDU86_007184 [Geranomyces michiganensis]
MATTGPRFAALYCRQLYRNKKLKSWQEGFIEQTGLKVVLFDDRAVKIDALFDYKSELQEGDEIDFDHFFCTVDAAVADGMMPPEPAEPRSRRARSPVLVTPARPPASTRFRNSPSACLRKPLSLTVTPRAIAAAPAAAAAAATTTPFGSSDDDDDDDDNDDSDHRTDARHTPLSKNRHSAQSHVSLPSGRGKWTWASPGTKPALDNDSVMRVETKARARHDVATVDDDDDEGLETRDIMKAGPAARRRRRGDVSDENETLGMDRGPRRQRRRTDDDGLALAIPPLLDNEEDSDAINIVNKITKHSRSADRRRPPQRPQAFTTPMPTPATDTVTTQLASPSATLHQSTQPSAPRTPTTKTRRENNQNHAHVASPRIKTPVAQVVLRTDRDLMDMFSPTGRTATPDEDLTTLPSDISSSATIAKTAAAAERSHYPQDGGTNPAAAVKRTANELLDMFGASDDDDKDGALSSSEEEELDEPLSRPTKRGVDGGR